MAKKMKKCPMGTKVKKHLKEDIHEFREQIGEDKALIKSMKGKMKSRSRSR